MEINTRDFGPITVDENDIFEFPEGIYGFEEDSRFALFTRAIDGMPFLYLQSIDNIIHCFLVFEPKDFYPGYSPMVSKEDLEDLEVNNIADLTFLLIANVPESIEEMSLNIKSPLILNPKSKTGYQVILQNPDYSVRYRPFLKEGKAGV